MDSMKFKEFISKVGPVKAKQAIENAEQTENQAEDWGIASKEKDQVDFIGDMTPETFFSQLRSAIAEVLGNKAPESEPGKPAADGKKKRPAKLKKPDHKLGPNEKPKAKGIDSGFMGFVLPGLAKNAIRSKDGSKNRSPGERKAHDFWRWIGFD